MAFGIAGFVVAVLVAVAGAAPASGAEVAGAEVAGTGVAGVGVTGTGVTGVEVAGAGAVATPITRCTVRDSRLRELSGLVTDGAQRRWAVSDGGSRVQVLEVAADCSVRRAITGSVNPFDVEDLARAPDGTFWLADTGDNGRSRSTVAMISLTPAGKATVYRLRYPDGPHDAEAVLLGRDGIPLIVTKEPLAPAGVYRPERRLSGPGGAAPVALRKVGEVSLPSSDTVGGPVGAVGSRTVTGGATSADGTVAALRTYTDAWLFHAPDGDLVAALGEPPLRVPLAGEPQGEAVALDDGAGALWSGSESRGGVPGALREVPGAVALAAGLPGAHAEGDEPSALGGDGVGAPGWLWGGGAALLLGALALAWRRFCV